LNTELMTVLKFSADDLEANRAGKLSTAQISRLRSHRQRSIIIGIVAIFVVALIATTFLYWGNEQSSPILTFIGVGVTILNATLVGGVFLRFWMRLNADLRGTSVTSICGETTFTVRMLNKRAALYVIRVENPEGFAELDVSRLAFEALRRHKGAYCLYRTSHSGRLLSLEEM
jgi:hypothetical protein